jgi:hypothetical protein
MDDFDEADEQNEEDLMLLGDEFANRGNLKQFIIDQFSEFIDNPKFKQGREYLTYCVKQLHEDDQKLAYTYLKQCLLN